MDVMDKQAAAEIIQTARFRAGKTWTEIAEAIDKPVVWTVSALLGQQPMGREEASTVGKLLNLDEPVVDSLRMQPYRGLGIQEIPTDPTLYRFYEALGVYGPALREVLHERFGDGIMSAINFKVDIDRRPDPAGDRVVITFDGKFLDYNW